MNDAEKFDATIKFLTEHFDELEFEEQLIFIMAFNKFVKEITPIYEKYNKEQIAIVKPKKKNKKNKDIPLWEVD